MLEPKDIDRFLIKSSSETEMQTVLGKIEMNNSALKGNSQVRRETVSVIRHFLRNNTMLPISIPTDPHHKRQSERIYARSESESQSSHLSEKNEISRKEYQSLLSKQAYELNPTNLKSVTT